jgi:hypothetical protein
MKFTKLFALAVLMAGTVAQAQLPSGRYTGFVSNNAFNEWCQLNRATVDFRVNTNGSANVYWEESGFARYPGAGFCDNRFDAVFTPTGRENEWNVTFNWNFDLNFGRATLKNGVLEITASYSGMNTGYQSLRTRMAVHPSNDSITYERRIDRFGPTLFANGVLYK